MRKITLKTIGTAIALAVVGGCKKEAEAPPPGRPVQAPRATTTAAATPTAPRPTAGEPPTPAARAVAPVPAGPRPAWYPAGFALPAGWRAEGQAVTTPHATSGELAWDRPLAEVLAEFQKELTASGWTLKSEEPRGKGGKRIRWEKGGETVQLSVFEVDGKARAIVVPPIRMGGAPR